MVPQGEIIGLDLTDEVDELVINSDRLNTLGSVFNEDIEAVGVLHARTALKLLMIELLGDEQEFKNRIVECAEPYFPPSCFAQLFNFRRTERLAVVIDMERLRD